MSAAIFNFSSFLLLTLIINKVNSYSTGDLGKHDIAGIWRLKSDDSSSLSTFHIPAVNSNNNDRQQHAYPLKEFTVYPKSQNEQQQRYKEEDLLLLLREDGKFSQYRNFASSSSTNKAAPKVPMTGNKAGYDDNDGDGMKGTWAFIDGNLILAADRPPTTEENSQTANSNDDGDNKKEHDTILVGRVVASSGERLLDNPALLEKDNVTTNTTITSSDVIKKDDDEKGGEAESLEEDVHLSVPSGKVQIGKFFYPRQHPSFFEKPIFHPKPNGSFELKQILGSLNTRLDDDDLEEKFRKEDLMGKRYFMTSFPSQYKRKRKQRWSIKYNKYVDKVPKTEREKELEKREKNSPVPIKTFEVELFANNTFSTIKGLGDMVLRGKWWIIGDKRDQLWMQVWRFGFGRSVSGSTFSEGSTLSQKDEVTYWGQIYKVDVDELEDEDIVDDDLLQEKGIRVEINGSVMSGWGLEPCSTARFTMIEKTEDDMEYYDDNSDDDDDDDDIEEYIPNLSDDIGSFE